MNADQLAPSALRWVLRLPLLSADEVAALLGVREEDAFVALADLARRGLVASKLATSPEMSARRLYHVRAEALAEIGEVLGIDPGTLQRYPVAPTELAARLVAIETTVGVNRFLARLAVACRREGGGKELGHAVAAPVQARRSDDSLPSIEAFGELRMGEWSAPFAVAWDRTGVPDAHRRARVSSWHAFAEQHETPTVLVVSCGEAEIDRWAVFAERSAQRRGSAPLPMALAPVTDALAGNPLGPIWRSADSGLRLPLVDRLRWASDRFAETSTSAERTPRATIPRPSVRRRPARIEILSRRASTVSTTAMRLLDWIAPHPFLSAADLSVLAGLDDRLVEQQLQRLGQAEIVRPIIRPFEGESTPPARYVLSADGLRLLAARDGVPPRRYLRRGHVVASDDQAFGSRRLAGLVRHYDHTVGVNSFFVRLAVETGHRGGRMLRWLNPTQATSRFQFGSGYRWIRPDGYAEILLNGLISRLFLEWDRGTVRPPKLREKFEAYGAWFSKPMSGDVRQRSYHVLIVVPNPGREQVLWRVVTALPMSAGLGQAARSATSALVARYGIFGSVWRHEASDHRSSIFKI